MVLGLGLLQVAVVVAGWWQGAWRMQVVPPILLVSVMEFGTPVEEVMVRMAVA